MKRISLVLFVLLSFIAVSCQRAPERNLVVTTVTHFKVQSNGASLNLPIFAGTLGVDQIVRDVTQAEYYQKKLAEVYKFQSFTLQEGASSEILIDREGDLKQPQRILHYEDSSSVMEILLTSFGKGTGQYTFRVSDRAGKQVRDHTVDVPSGKSASIGMLFDKQNGIGHIVVISLRSLATTSKTTPSQLAAFLREKNSLPSDTATARYEASDQKWMDELFGPGKMELPVREAAQSDSVPTPKFAKFDTPPSLIGGLNLKYPELARKDSIEGRVVVTILVSKSGRAEQCRLIRGVRADLDSAAIDAIRQARFNPATLKGDTISVFVTLPIMFKLRP